MIHVEALDERHTGEDEDAAQHERAEDAPEQHPVLELAGHHEVAEDQRPHEHVVDGEALLDEEARVVLTRGCGAMGRQQHEPEGQADADPHRALDCGLFGGSRVGPAMDDEQVDCQQQRDEREKRGPPPERCLEVDEVLV